MKVIILLIIMNLFIGMVLEFFCCFLNSIKELKQRLWRCVRTLHRPNKRKPNQVARSNRQIGKAQTGRSAKAQAELLEKQLKLVNNDILSKPNWPTGNGAPDEAKSATRISEVLGIRCEKGHQHVLLSWKKTHAKQTGIFYFPFPDALLTARRARPVRFWQESGTPHLHVQISPQVKIR